MVIRSMKLMKIILESIGSVILIIGAPLSFVTWINGEESLALKLLVMAIIGAFIAYIPYRSMKNIVSKLPGLKDVYYDEKGLYYDTLRKPYIFKWDEIKEYRILSVTEIDLNTRGIGTTLMPVLKIFFDLARFIAWRKIDPEYATTGIMKLGTVQFIKKDDSSIVLTHVINPYRLIPIFDRYIKENSQKKSYHM
jgi:uncharacterized membrane protein YeaQ/YmgE (transglycosylase-associated protein family)